IIRWEYPLWRFASNDVLELIKKKISEEEYFNIYSSFVKKLISYNYSDLWGRIGILADRAKDEKTWIYSKIRELRNSNSMQEGLEVLNKIINRRKKELYLRKMSRMLIETQRFSEAIDILNGIKEKTILDRSFMVRCYSYLGRYEEAEKILRDVIENLNLCYELPEVLCNISSYHFLRKETQEGLSLLNSHIKDIINLKTSPKYLSNYYNSLAIHNSMEGKLDDALYFYYLALENAKKSDNKFSLFKVINNLGDLGRYIYGPKHAIKYNLEAFELSKSFSKNISALSLANVLNSSSQFYPMEATERLTQELEKFLKEINVEYFNYVGYRRLIILNIYYHKLETVKNYISYIEKIKTINESTILINIIKGYLGEDLDWELWEREVLKTKDDQIILLYLNLLLRKNLSSQIIIKEFSSELPFYGFLRGLMKRDNILSLLTHIDSMFDRWEFLDALNSYLHLIDYLERERDKNSEPFLYNSYFEALSLSYLLGLDHVREKILTKMGNLYDFIINKHMQLKVLESYLYNAIISAENEDQVLEILFRTFSDFFKDFLIKIQIGSNIIKEGNILLGEDTLKYYYTKSPFSIFLYSKETSDPYIIFLLRTFLKAFIIFWERKYGLYDPLTGLYNRAYGDKRLEEACLDYKRIKEPFSVIFIDVDSLKKINDTYGHSYGDFVLQQVASCIKNTIRQNDFAIRWGGDEFLILLRRVDYEDALKIAQRIDEKLEEVFKGELGISYGIEVSSDEIENHEDMIKRADIKMYTSKYEKLKKKA
ncbi:MAG: GGDEF domain-containing protein, partial [Dictyoglomaceae bacterium]|nr:GGDEF domain-containing protein [Dictyoglomaceae bacterium]